MDRYDYIINFIKSHLPSSHKCVGPKYDDDPMTKSLMDDSIWINIHNRFDIFSLSGESISISKRNNVIHISDNILQYIPKQVFELNEFSDVNFWVICRNSN